MTEAQQTARVLRNLAEENRKLRLREKKLTKYLHEAVECVAHTPWGEENGFTLALADRLVGNVTRWRKAL